MGNPRRLFSIQAAKTMAAVGALLVSVLVTLPPLTVGAATTVVNHSYRHGAVPLRGSQVAAPLRVSGSSLLSYRGGSTFSGEPNLAISTGPEKIYVVFWGSLWGTDTVTSTTTGGVTYQTDSFTNDSLGLAPRLEALYAGLGTNGELWSGVLTQYCQGVASGATTCAASNAHVAYPSGSVLAGVWYDNSSVYSSTKSSTQAQLGAEAVAAATHFNNKTNALNANAQYIIVSPTGTSPDGFGASSNFCAWHDYTGDSTLGYTAPANMSGIAFTNMPYLTDLGGSCGANYVNAGSNGTLDGVTIVAGHEYAETVTDQFPASGWYNNSGGENGDECAWSAGVSQNVAFATGSFAMQSTYGNDANSGTGGCQISHAIVNNSYTTPTKLATTTAPVMATDLKSFTTQPVVSLEDSSNNVIYGGSSSVTVSSNSGTLTGTLTVPVVAGVATFTDLAFSAAPTSGFTLTFTDSLGGVTVLAITIGTPAVAGVASQLSVTTQPVAVVNGVAMTTDPVVAVLDGLNNPVTGITPTVTASIASGSASITAGSSVAVDTTTGTATFSGLTIQGTAGSFALKFTIASPALSVTSNTFNLTAGSASKIVLTTQPSTSATDGTAFSSQPVVKVEDSSGSVVTTQSSGTVTASSSSATATLSATNLTVTFNQGVATFGAMKLTGLIGSYQILFATSLAFTSLTSSTVTLKVGAASKLELTTAPTGSVHTSSLNAIVVAIQDVGGNLVTSTSFSGVTVRATLASSSPTGATLSGTTSVSTKTGSASFSALKVSAAGSFTLKFTVTSPALSITSGSFTLT